MCHKVRVKTFFGREVVFFLPFDYQKNFINGYAITYAVTLLKSLPEQDGDFIVYIKITETGR